ncbi:unnamed protein product [Cuscuta campestris]|uniref:Uncharacterized protein n=1 Tax=Cuscuta campestris TaxID=132261 RepID=A0A484LCE9_9ASTE|nr:unnamed protein product [Cuscuta campestris]
MSHKIFFCNRTLIKRKIIGNRVHLMKILVNRPIPARILPEFGFKGENMTVTRTRKAGVKIEPRFTSRVDIGDEGLDGVGATTQKSTDNGLTLSKPNQIARVGGAIDRRWGGRECPVNIA